MADDSADLMSQHLKDMEDREKLPVGAPNRPQRCVLVVPTAGLTNKTSYEVQELIAPVPMVLRSMEWLEANGKPRRLPLAQALGVPLAYIRSPNPMGYDDKFVRVVRTLTVDIDVPRIRKDLDDYHISHLWNPQGNGPILLFRYDGEDLYDEHLYALASYLDECLNGIDWYTLVRSAYKLYEIVQAHKDAADSSEFSAYFRKLQESEVAKDPEGETYWAQIDNPVERAVTLHNVSDSRVRRFEWRGFIPDPPPQQLHNEETGRVQLVPEVSSLPPPEQLPDEEVPSIDLGPEVSPLPRHERLAGAEEISPIDLASEAITIPRPEPLPEGDGTNPTDLGPEFRAAPWYERFPRLQDMTAADLIPDPSPSHWFERLSEVEIIYADDPILQGSALPYPASVGVRPIIEREPNVIAEESTPQARGRGNGWRARIWRGRYRGRGRGRGHTLQLQTQDLPPRTENAPESNDWSAGHERLP